MIDIKEIEDHIRIADDVVTNIEPSSQCDIPHLLHGILNALLAQAKVQLLAVQQAAEDRAMRMEQMAVGKELMGRMTSVGNLFCTPPTGEDDGLRQFNVSLSTGEKVVVLAADESNAIRFVTKRLEDLGLEAVDVLVEGATLSDGL